MQFGSSRKLHHSPQETTYLPPEISHSLPYEIINLLRRPLVLVILVWALLFLILGVAFVHAQDAGAVVKQKHAAASSGGTIDRGSPQQRSAIHSLHDNYCEKKND
jgi:hypothetical protein